MCLIKLDIKHGRTLDDARTHLERAVSEVEAMFGRLVQRVEWAADRSAVKICGTGFEVEMRVDAQEVHVTGDFPWLGGLLGGPLAAGVQEVVQQTFKRLPHPGR